MNWTEEILLAVRVKTTVSLADVEDLWKYYYPNPRGGKEAIERCEEALGFSLDPEHRDFLRHANGWKAYFHDVDIMSTHELVEGPLYERASELVNSLDDFKELYGFERSELLPFAVSARDIDLFMIGKPGTSQAGKVFWFAGQLIEERPSFSEWFLAMVDYSRLDYQRYVKKYGPIPQLPSTGAQADSDGKLLRPVEG